MSVLEGDTPAEVLEFLTPTDMASTRAFTELERGIYGFKVGRMAFPLADFVEDERAEYALLLEPLIAKRAKGRMKKGKADPEKKSAQGERVAQTREEVAKAANVSHDTIRKVKVIAERADDATKQKLRAGETTIHREYQKVAPPKQPANGKYRDNLRSLKQALEAREKRIIIATLQTMGQSRNNTAAQLGINRTTLFNKMRKYGLLLGRRYNPSKKGAGNLEAEVQKPFRLKDYA